MMNRAFRRPALAVVFAFACLRMAPAAEEPAAKGGPDPARLLGMALSGIWRDRPEWGDMLVAILKGEALQRGKGWWRPSQKLRGWEWLRAHADVDGQGRIGRDGLPAEALIFERLDADGDGALSAADFDPPGGIRPPGADALYFRLDRDSNGRISREELDGFFRDADSGELGYLSRDDIRRALIDPEEAGGGKGDDMPSPWIMASMLLAGHLGSLSEGPGLGAPAPDFRLRPRDGGPEVALSSYRGKRPVILIFGSFT